MGSGRLLLAAIGLLLFSTINVDAKLPRMFLGRDTKGFVLRVPSENVESREGIMGVGYFKQILDHNAATPQYWDQRYFFNSQYKQRNSDINFLNIGGEGEESLYSIAGNGNPFVSYAQQFGAGLYSLEHRFYGKSRPTPKQDLASLKLLTSQQALADLANFIQYVNNASAVPQRWVVFGGSYAGAMTLWMREKYPDVVIGGVGSSGPVLAQLDFTGYLQVVEADVYKFDARNPNNAVKCADAIGAGLDQAQLLMQTPAGRTQLDTIFKNVPKLNETQLDDDTLSTFYQSLIGAFMGAAQYGGLGGYLTIDQVCTAVVGGDANTPAIQRLRTAMTLGGDPNGENDIDFQGQVDQLNKEEWDDEISDTRSWFWQTCNEFGYYQSTDRGSNIFRATIPVNNFLNLFCADLYKVSTEQVQKNIDKTNAYYGERAYYTGTNVFAAYGTQDPWHWLAKHDSQDPSVVTYSMKDGVHCRDMYDARGDLWVQTAQALIRQNLDRWINGPVNPVSKLNISDNIGDRPRNVPFNAAPISFYSRAQSEAKLAAKAIQQEHLLPNRMHSGTGRHFRHGLQAPPPAVGSWPPGLREATITLPFDHFNNTDPRTFKARFFANSKFGSKAGPNFLMIGGEGPESDKWVMNEDIAMVTYAKAVGANIYLLEHRYYGESKLGTTDLRFLTSAQMLFDVATFIETAKFELGLTGPWITFGGSYSGALAAWSREWFPDVISAAVGSSGPVQAKVDFYEYLIVVEKAITAYSKDCASNVTAAFSTVRSMAKSREGRAQLSHLFNIQPSLNNTETVTPEAIQNVLAGLYGYFQGVIQYSNDNNAAGAANVETLCAFVLNGTTPLEGLKHVADWEGNARDGLSGDPNADNAFLKGMISHIDGHDQKYSDGDLAAILWTWQTCNEFGYYQSTDYGLGMFGSVTPVNLNIQMCEQVFGVNFDQVTKSVDQILYQYGGRYKYKGTNVVLPNGNHDPWHALGKLESSDPSVIPIVIEGTAHCADMYPARDSDLPGLTAARKQILEIIKGWLAAGPSPTGNVTPPPTANGGSSASPTGKDRAADVSTGQPSVSPATGSTDPSPSTVSSSGTGSTAPANMETTTSGAFSETISFFFLALIAVLML